MLRIVHYHPRLRLIDGGFARAIFDWCTVLARRGNAVTLVTCDPADLPPEWADGRGPEVILISPPTASGFHSGNAMDKVVSVLTRADVAHLHEVWLLSNAQVARTCRSLGIPYVFTLHGMLDDWSMTQRPLRKRAYLMCIGASLLAGAARLHCTALAESKQAAQWIDHPSVALLPYIVDLQPYRELPGPELAEGRFDAVRGEGPKILFLSRLHPKKGVELFIDAIARLSAQGLEVTGLIAGSGQQAYERELRQRASDAVETKVQFLGQVSGREKISLYQSADVFVLPTSQENFGYVVIEALACGTPVITTKGVDIWQEVEQAGALIAQPTHTAIAAAIERLLSSPEAARERGARGREWVLTEFDSDRLADAYERLYTDVKPVDV